MTDTELQNGYFRLIALEDCTFTLTSGNATPNISSIFYSIDEGTTWSSIEVSTEGVNLPQVSTADSILFKGTMQAEADNAHITISSTGNFDAAGNVMSLIVGENYNNETVITYSYAFAKLFQNNTHLIHAHNLILPATRLTTSCYRYMFDGCTSLITPPQHISSKLYNVYSCQYMFRGCSSMLSVPSFYVYTAANYSQSHMFEKCTSITSAASIRLRGCSFSCFAAMFFGCTSLIDQPDMSEITSMSGSYNFDSMFEGCTSLTTAQTIPVTQLAPYCFYSMYYDCTNLINPPELPLTTLASNCYGYMFYGCTSLETAPELPATKLVSGCYTNMFRNCKKLTQIKAMFTSTPANDFTPSWVAGVSPTGIFIKNSEASWSVVGTNGIPEGWAVQDESCPTIIRRSAPQQIIIRRHLMLSTPPANSYIQNGLIFQLDGLEKGNNANAWTDLIDDRVYSNHGAIEVKDGWIFDGVDDYMDNPDDLTNLCFGETGLYQGTTEVVIDRGTDTKDSPIFVFRHYSSLMGQKPQRGLIIRTGNINIQSLTRSTIWNNSSSDIPVGKVCTYSRGGNMTYAMVDLVSKERVGWAAPFMEPDGNYIGRFTGNWGGTAYFQGKILAIRLYNRILSTTEAKRNQKIDNIRFKIGL